MPVSLEVLNLSGAGRKPHKFTGGIPSEWSSMTNLKELSMANCGLDGEGYIFALNHGHTQEKDYTREVIAPEVEGLQAAQSPD